MNSQQLDVVIIGGGLAGLAAARELEILGKKLVLIDAAPDLKSGVGGFARFSGAKFSLYPAGKGLLPFFSSEKAYLDLEEKIIYESGLAEYPLIETSDRKISEEKSSEHRAYKSYLLTPEEIEKFIEDYSKSINNRVINKSCSSITEHDGLFCVILEDNQKIFSRSIIYAAGRKSSEILESLGAEPTNGKGFDVGFRIEFTDLLATQNLRLLGADAKIIFENTRTFCLNSPGRIFRYSYESFSIPGGVVANTEEKSSNFGVLTRIPTKDLLPNVLERLKTYDKLKDYVESIHDLSNFLQHAYGKSIAEQQIKFLNLLEEENLVDFNYAHIFHIPLLDWHWNIYAQKDSFETSREGLYVCGDAAGHARGLLQAMISGILCAQQVGAKL